MVLYVAYRASKESKDRSVLPHRLKQLGCKQLHRAFWKIDEDKVNTVLKLLEKNQPILLKREREIRKPQYMKNKGNSQLGSLVIVMYSTPKEIKREKVKNVLKRAPCIRLCRSVYAFSQKHSLFDKNNELVDAWKFATFIKGIQEDVKVIPRAVIVNKGSVERLLEEIRQRVEREVHDINRCCMELYDRVLVGDDIQRIRVSLSKNKRRFITVKKVAAFYEKWLGMDFSKGLMKAYRAVEKVNFMVKENKIPIMATQYFISK
jgi:hypothetical protein